MWYYVFSHNANYEPSLRIQFGAYVEYLSGNPRDKDEAHPSGPKARQGLLMGYHEKLGGIWSGDKHIMDILKAQIVLSCKYTKIYIWFVRRKYSNRSLYTRYTTVFLLSAIA